jgi:callose synthase
MQKDLIKRLYSLLTIKESAANVPKNLEARRRLQFFTNSLFMRMPVARPASETLSFRCGSPFPVSFIHLVVDSHFFIS